MTKTDEGATRAVNKKIHLNAADIKKHNEKNIIEPLEHSAEFQPIKPDPTTISIPLHRWLSQTSTEEPFNLAGWKFKSSMGIHAAEPVSNNTDGDADRWSLRAVYGSDDEYSGG